jgi:hypothetical protein
MHATVHPHHAVAPFPVYPCSNHLTRSRGYFTVTQNMQLRARITIHARINDSDLPIIFTNQYPGIPGLPPSPAIKNTLIELNGRLVCLCDRGSTFRPIGILAEKF